MNAFYFHCLRIADQFEQVVMLSGMTHFSVKQAHNIFIPASGGADLDFIFDTFIIYLCIIFPVTITCPNVKT